MNVIFLSGPELENTLGIASRLESYKFAGIQFVPDGSIRVFDTSKDLNVIHSAVQMQTLAWKAMANNPTSDVSLLFWN